MDFEFTPQQIQQFREAGWVSVPHFWTPREVEAMRNELDHFKAAGLLRNVATAGDGVTPSGSSANLQLCPMSPHSGFFRAMPWAPKVRRAVEQLIGGPILLHLDQVFLKPGLHGAGTNWHQDNAYFKIANPLDGTAVWTAVHEATVANGTLRIIPNAYREPLEHSRDPDSDHHVRCYPDESAAIDVELPAGGAVFFAYGTPHATGPNGTASERAGVALHFINERASENAPGGSGEEKRPYLSGPRCSGGEKEYGERVEGTWETWVDRLTP